MTAQEIKQNMSIPDWTILDGHEGGKDIIDDKGVFLFEVNSEEYSSDTDRANLFAIVTAVNGTYGVGIDPSKVKEMAKMLSISLGP